MPEGIKKPKKIMLDRVYSPVEIRQLFFPKNLIGDKQYDFISQKDNVEFFVPACVCPLQPSVHVSDGCGGHQMANSVDFGSYRVRFVNKRYTTKNILEYKAIYNMPGVVCIGESKPLVEAKVEKKTKKKDDDGHIPTL